MAIQKIGDDATFMGMEEDAIGNNQEDLNCLNKHKGER